MGILTTANELHYWNYFLVLEADVDYLAKYVEICSDNYQTYSIEILRLITSFVGEVETLLKLLEKRHSQKCKNIHEHIKFLQKYCAGISEFVVKIPRFSIESLTPWQVINQEYDFDKKTPSWWDVNNQIKHRRHTNYQNANLFRLLESMAALYACNIFYYRDQALSGSLLPSPKLCRPTQKNYNGNTMNEFEIGINYTNL
ncbi:MULTISPECIES: hypothetical protein [Cysteiniphilum]|uniref:hypothetical protein n=1 Tax=Cysteiniphilum TaxID=2056696 RepID=UPI00177C710F|nr:MULTISPECIES: hypothetical protein [Cysteiniphilum]